MTDELALLKHAAAESVRRHWNGNRFAACPLLVKFYPLLGTYELEPYSQDGWAISDFQQHAHHATMPTQMEPEPYRYLGIVRKGAILAQLQRDGDNAMNGARRTFEFVNRREHLDSDELCCVEFGLTFPDGSTCGDMQMTWYEIGGQSTPRLECFDDGWRVLATFADVTAALAAWDDQLMSPQEFMHLLTALGFTNITKE